MIAMAIAAAALRRPVTPFEFKPDGVYETRDGKPVKFLYTDNGHMHWFALDGRVCTRRPDGKLYSDGTDSAGDIVPGKVKKTLTMHIYDTPGGLVSKPAPWLKGLPLPPGWKLFAKKNLEFVEGEGL